MRKKACEGHGAYKVRCLHCDDPLCGYCFDLIDEDMVAVCVKCRDKRKLRGWNEWAEGEEVG